MPPDLLLALVVFAVVTCFTPGPNNVMLLASGLNFGLARSMPHVLGVALGFAFMTLAVSLGVGRLILTWPALHGALQAASILYMLWLAWRIANAGPIETGETSGRPLSFVEACAFQWINPKGWVIALSVAAGYVVAGRLAESTGIIAAVYAVVGLASAASWALFGSWLKALLSAPRAVRVFNWAMAALLVASLWPIVLEVAASR